MKHHVLSAFAAAFAASGAIVAIVGTVFLFGSEVQSYLFPVNTDFNITSIQNDKEDVIVSATMVKRWGCEYKPPLQGQDENGGVYAGTCIGPACGMSWPPSPQPRPVTWRIPGAAGRIITLTNRHECHPLWDTYTRLGVVDARWLQ